MFPKYVVIVTQFGQDESGSTTYRTFYNSDDAHNYFNEFCDSRVFDVAMFRCIKQHYENL